MNHYAGITLLVGTCIIIDNMFCVARHVKQRRVRKAQEIRLRFRRPCRHKNS